MADPIFHLEQYLATLRRARDLGIELAEDEAADIQEVAAEIRTHERRTRSRVRLQAAIEAVEAQREANADKAAREAELEETRAHADEYEAEARQRVAAERGVSVVELDAVLAEDAASPPLYLVPDPARHGWVRTTSAPEEPPDEETYRRQCAEAEEVARKAAKLRRNAPVHNPNDPPEAA